MRRGDVVLVDTILIQITHIRHGIPGTEVEIDPAVETVSGRSHVCYALCFNLLLEEQVRIDQTMGYLSDALMQQIGDCLKIVLKVP